MAQPARTGDGVMHPLESRMARPAKRKLTISAVVLLATLGLPDDTLRVLYRRGVATVGDVMRLGPTQLQLLRGIGPHRYRAIEQAVVAKGLPWPEDTRKARSRRQTI